ncbi:class I SAM-dependent methyltransferase [Anaerocolumna chitinilytica]|uniref:Type 11 methyltransferase n=1 Tax=Anaerocolumna chitinilytica TaxID=1727145 RepID=A0A7I8DRJ4_9FIRM|nr:class I SAM-dependent methyltransferase [Anaerocolumna chitinilytica]BCK01051.1 type 11 methyltransferase [Anaerocolumna chitinilytica]
MKKGKYGLDAPAIVIGYITSGVLLTLMEVIYFSSESWILYFGCLCLVIGSYMIYSSRIGKYKMRERIIQKLCITGDEISLDVGCGRGLLLNGVASKLNTGKVYGVDIWSVRDESGNNYNTTMQNARIEGTESKVEVINSDMRNLPFTDSYFDIIVSSLAIHNLKNNDQREKALLEIARVAKKGCKLAILDIAHINFYRNILSNNGFDIEYIERSVHIFPPSKVIYARKS